ncbi:MAG: 30S ribosomal protein S6 [Helicobacteraceae bacterium]|jgi:small subunit ribosomal protein S6|nr:30S ribosomal protein S6 [Helicobacteraceae bacterium]
MRHYENLVIVKPTLTEEETKASIAAIEEVLTSNGAEIIARDAMGTKKLAYPIAKNERGYFHVVYYTMAPSSIAEVERRFRINEDLLRFLTIKYDSKREVTAWNGLVAKTEKKAAAKIAAATAATETPVVEEAPAVETPVVETPVAEAETKAPTAE